MPLVDWRPIQFLSMDGSFPPRAGRLLPKRIGCKRDVQRLPITSAKI